MKIMAQGDHNLELNFYVPKIFVYEHSASTFLFVLNYFHLKPFKRTEYFIARVGLAA